MINRENYQVLTDIIQAVKNNYEEEDYPETYEAIDVFISPMCNLDGTVPQLEDYEMFDLVSQIVDADKDIDMCEDLSKVVVGFYEREIAKGITDAMLNLGAFYYNGRDGQVDYKKAIRFYKMASSNGNMIATENLGYCYYYGRDVEVDYEKAFNYFLKGAILNMPISTYKIGDMYRYGKYVEKDEAFALETYFKALAIANDAEVVDPATYDIELRIAECELEGIGTEVNLTKALMFAQAAEVGYLQEIKNGNGFLKDRMEKAIGIQEKARKGSLVNK